MIKGLLADLNNIDHNTFFDGKNDIDVLLKVCSYLKKHKVYTSPSDFEVVRIYDCRTIRYYLPDNFCVDIWVDNH